MTALLGDLAIHLNEKQPTESKRGMRTRIDHTGRERDIHPIYQYRLSRSYLQSSWSLSVLFGRLVALHRLVWLRNSFESHRIACLWRHAIWVCVRRTFSSSDDSGMEPLMAVCSCMGWYGVDMGRCMWVGWLSLVDFSVRFGLTANKQKHN